MCVQTLMSPKRQAPHCCWRSLNPILQERMLNGPEQGSPDVLRQRQPTTEVRTNRNTKLQKNIDERMSKGYKPACFSLPAPQTALLHWEPHVRWSLPFSPQRFSCLRSSQWRPLVSPEPWLYTSPGSPAWWAPPRSSKPSDHQRSATHRQVAHSLSPERRTRKGRCDIWEWDRIKTEVALWFWVSITQSSLLYTEICSFSASFTELFAYFACWTGRIQDVDADVYVVSQLLFPDKMFVT